MGRRTFLAFVLVIALLLAACAGHPEASPSPGADTPTAAPTATVAATPTVRTTPTPAASPTPTTIPTPVPTVPLSSLTLAGFPRLDGSTSTIPLAIAVLCALTGCSETEAERHIAFSTTDPSYLALSSHEADLLLVYPPAQPTVDQLDVFHRMDVKEIGRDALVFIVNDDNPVVGLTSAQVRGIYAGTIVNWKQVGGADQPIVAFQRPTLSGSQTLMLDLMMKGTPMMPATQETIAGQMGNLIDDVASYDGTANAIGYSVYYYATMMYARPGLRFLAIDGVLPSTDSIARKTYGLTSPFYGILPLDPTSQAKTVRDWLLTDAGQRLVAAAGYVPIRPVD